MRPRVCVVAASEMTVRAFLAPHLRLLQTHYDLTVVVNTSNPGLLRELGVDGILEPIAIERRVSPRRDAAALWALYRVMRRGRFAVVHSMTPKAGLLAMAAARLAGVPVRVHTFTGQVWATRSEPVRSFLRSIDRLMVRLATHAFADSASQREFLVREGVARASAIEVLGSGSVSGVDTAVFKPDAAARRRVRAELRIPESDVVLLFLGRLTTDKGVLDLAAAFDRVARVRAGVRLLFAGPDESGLRSRIGAVCAGHVDRVHFLDFTERPHEVMAAADVLCLPSYREGFGSVVIEAAACGIPTIASRIYGIVDAIDDGRTGLLHPARDVDALAALLHCVIDDPQLRRSLGDAARIRAVREFPVERLTGALAARYAEMMPNAVACGWYRRAGKRIVDVLVSGVALALLSPVLLAVALAVRVGMGAPVLFRQRRPGRAGVPFTILKFRSMTDRYDYRGRALPDGERLTAVGRFLRASSLDELPELVNVLRGDMSLVGPRPLLMEYLPLYDDVQARRHEVRPGITGLAQVSGRNRLSWPERFALDVEYVDRCSFLLDLTILAKTFWSVIAARGITQPGTATVDYFRGNVGADG